MTLMPGLVDAHCHLLALATSWQGLDCSPEAVSSIEELKQAVHRRAATTPPGRWVRGFGYDELALAGGRHPTRWDLDQAAPQHPVRLDHRSGHATALNSLALELAGIHRDTADPVEGVIERDAATGEPTGLLLELAGFLRQRLGLQRDETEFQQGIERLSQRLLQYGITSAQDAGPANDLVRWETFQDLKASGRLACRVTVLVGASHVAEFQNAGWRYGAGDAQLRLGPAKAMLTLTTGVLHPDDTGLAEIVAEAQQAGFPIAIHAVEQEAVAAAAQALLQAPPRPSIHPPLEEIPSSPPGKGGSGEISVPGRWPRNRIEHCAECPPELVTWVRQCGAMVVTQPGFIYWNGDRYLERVAPSLLPHLYPVGALARAGVPLAFGSDAPVIDPNPWPTISSAVIRATRSGRTLPPYSPSQRGDEGISSQRVSVWSALRMHTLGGAFAEGTEMLKGTISRGKLADMVLLDADPTGVALSKIKDIRVALTVLGGQVVWDSGLLGR
jgi:predicted amidohydrolase YtcJ